MFLAAMFEYIPDCFSLILNLFESYPLSAKIIPGFPTELFTMVGIASGISCLLPEAKTTLKGVPKKSVITDNLVPVFYTFQNILWYQKS